jgi:uncharacterized protein
MRVRQLALNGIASPWQVYCCDTFRSRAWGRLGASDQERRLVWRLCPCRAVHTWFLSGPIDVAFCDRAGGILSIVAPLRPWHCSWRRGADTVWEFPAGLAGQLGLRPGDGLSLCD